MANFADYKIHIVDSEHYPGKFVAYIEELHSVKTIIDNKQQAEEALEPIFNEEIKRYQDDNEAIPEAGSGKAEITFAPSDKIEALRPFVDEFWDKIIGTSYSTSFISNDSQLYDWEHYLINGKKDIIVKVKTIYNVDIEPIYDEPIHEILTTIKRTKDYSFIGRLKQRLKAWFNPNNSN